ncbi:MAG: insulinase family protein, partial [Erysipelotrichaceae bacterium]|nr:insulinase family protein [Erysipelotrichaceae bacterium]
MNRYQMDITEKVLSNGMRVILVHKPDYNRSLFMLSTRAGGFDIKQRVKGEIVTHPSGCAHFLEHQMFRLNQVDVTDEFASMGAQT